MDGRRLIPHLRTLWILIVGSVLGYLMAQMFLIADNRSIDFKTYQSKEGHERYYRNKQYNREELFEEVQFDAHEHSHEDNSMADYLQKEVRILCWIMTQPENHKSKAMHVKRTWGKRCNKLLFMSSTEDKELGTIALPVHEGRESLWNKTKEAFKYIYKHHLDDADWFFKADDDTYSVVENLRYMLYPYSPDTPIYFGCKFKPYVKQGYMSGGAGYVLSKEAVRRLGPQLWNEDSPCSENQDPTEDLHMGLCLEELGVIAGDSRDAFQRGRFFPFTPEDHLIPNAEEGWYLNYSYYAPHLGLECCSDNAIAFHYIPPRTMYVMDYLIYHLHPIGISKLPEKLQTKLDPNQVIELYKPKN